MILVKSLIAILFIILLYFLYNHFYLLKKFDGREGFASASEAGTSAAGTSAEGVPEIKYTLPSPLNKHKQMASDADMMGDLQDKMNELLNLKEQAIEINNNLK